MPHHSERTAQRVIKHLKRVLREEIDPEVRLNWCQRAVAEAWGSEHFQDIMTSLPCEAEWDGDACARFLSDNGYMTVEDARHGVACLEEDLGFLLDGRERAAAVGCEAAMRLPRERA